MEISPQLAQFEHLGLSLGIGPLIGLERGWEQRGEVEGRRVAGLRTYGIVGLSGGCVALIAGTGNEFLVGFGIVGVAILFAVAYFRRSEGNRDIGATSALVGILTFVLGALVPLGFALPAAAAAVVTTLLLSFKPTLHAWIVGLEEQELRATLKLLLISVVLLPVLPDRTMGPLNVFNPYETWWMVVLIAGISYLGYFAMKLGGAQRGALLTGIFGGLAASTAVTLSLSRLARQRSGMDGALASGILAACATMYPRILAIVLVVNRDLFPTLLPILGTMAAGTYLTAGLAWWSARGTEPGETPAISNPFRLMEAVRFGLLLVVILVLSRLLVDSLGHRGVYYLAAVSGLADVDAITLSLSRMSPIDLPLAVAGLGILVAAIVNGLAKSAIAFAVGGIALGWRVAAGLLMPVAAGIAVYLVPRVS
jgi:uncharacterized membrane protein (DUF4010 family)